MPAIIESRYFQVGHLRDVSCGSSSGSLGASKNDHFSDRFKFKGVCADLPKLEEMYTKSVKCCTTILTADVSSIYFKYLNSKMKIHPVLVFKHLVFFCGHTVSATLKRHRAPSRLAARAINHRYGAVTERLQYSCNVPPK